MKDPFSKMFLSFIFLTILKTYSAHLTKSSHSEKHFVKAAHHYKNSLNSSLQYLDLFQSDWILSNCDEHGLFNQTISKMWPSTMYEMAFAASEFFYLGNHSIEYKVDYLSNSSNISNTSFFELVSWIIYMIMPITVFMAILFFLFCCQVFCIKKYRLFARCCMIDLNSYSGSSKEKFGLFCCILFSGTLMILSIIFVILNNDVFLGYSESKCLMYNLAIEIYTPSNDSWIGTIEIDSRLSNTSNIYLKISEDSTFNETSYINISSAFNSYNILLDEFDTNLTIYQNSTLYNPNPLTNENEPNLSSSFLNNWGPTKKSGTVLYYLKSELETRNTYLELLETALEDSKYLYNQSQNFSEICSLRKSDFEEFGENFGDFFFEISNFYISKESIVETFFNGIIIFLCLNVLPLILGFFGFILVGFFKWRFCNCCLHCAWICNCLLIFALMNILFFSYFFTGLAFWGCEIYNESMHNSQTYSLISQKMNFNDTLNQSLYFCLFNSTSNLANYYSFGSSLELSDELYAAVSTLSNHSLSTNYLENEIINLQNYYTNYELMAGKVNNANSDHPVSVMQTLNLWSNYDSVGSYQSTYGVCDVTTDEYVFNQDQCIYDNIYASGESESIGFGDPLCISLNESSKDFAKLRYSEKLFNQCSSNISNFKTVPEAIEQYYMNLFEYKTQTQKLALEMIKSLEDYQQDMEKLDSQIEILYNESKGGFDSFENLFAVTSVSTGLSKNLNCSFLTEGFEKMKDSLCITMMDGLFYVYITLLFLLLLQMILALANCLASIRMLPRDFDSEDEGKVLIEKNSSIELRRHSILY